MDLANGLATEMLWRRKRNLEDTQEWTDLVQCECINKVGKILLT